MAVQMHRFTVTGGLLNTLAHALSHVFITVLAVGIAFSLPVAAQYILFNWWPRVEADPNLLLITETGLASVLVLLFNASKIAWDNRRKVAVANLASLVYARGGNNWFARWRDRPLFRQHRGERDVYILTLTGFDTFVAKDSLLGRVLETAYEVRVMLLNPHGAAAERRVRSLPDGVTLQSFRAEIEASISYLASLQKSGKKVTLKFYDREPLWKVVVLGERVCVQYCPPELEVKRQPEYVFALHRRNPNVGFFAPFYRHFIDQWSDAANPEYDFETGEMVYRDEGGNEIRRVSRDRADSGEAFREAENSLREFDQRSPTDL